ncbi:MAG: hypothetical protein CL910_03510 [Deltaproteobacteria bacterium]|nr:hypothetical protein [Deltaproteobacteria bacterium]
MTGRFAPSTTGRAHLGTLLAALLCWLDARSRGGRILLRMEDLDPERCRPEYAGQMQDDLLWLGLDFDAVVLQSDLRAAHERALDQLAAEGHLYPCSCSRAEVRAHGLPAPDGGWRYPGTCRARPLPMRGWRVCEEAIRLRLPRGFVDVPDESGLPIGHDPAALFGDPVVRRRDGAMAYHLAASVDDASAGVTHVVRGRDLATTTPTQVRVQEALGLPRPVYRHHLLLLEEQGGKLAKLHGSADASQLRSALSPPELCGHLAHSAGLRAEPLPTVPGELLVSFSWDRVRGDDRVAHWDGRTLSLSEPA